MNLLSKVTRALSAHYDDETSEFDLRSESGASFAYEKSDKRCRMDWETCDANFKLFAASYDHALLLAALCDGKARLTGRHSLSDINTHPSEWPPAICLSVGSHPDRQTPHYDIPLDPFGCPILTDELRGELEGLVLGDKQRRNHSENGAAKSGQEGTDSVSPDPATA